MPLPMPAPTRLPTRGPAAVFAAVALATLPASARAGEATTLLLPWGDALAAAIQAAGTVLVPVAVAAATALLARVAGPLRVLVTAALVERLVRNAADYAVNAVAGAVRGRVLPVPLAAAVIEAAVRRARDQAPTWLVAAAGGPEGLAEKVFRRLPLEAQADAANTLRPALQAALGAPRRT